MGIFFRSNKVSCAFQLLIGGCYTKLAPLGLIEDGPAGLRLTPYGDSELTGLASLRRFRGRLGYVGAACQSTTAIPLPIVTASLAAEPQLLRAHELDSLRPLLDETGRHALMAQFAALAQAVPRSNDLFVPAVVSLTYLSRQVEASAVDEIGVD